MAQRVSEDECKEMNRLYEQGVTRYRIAEDVDRHPTTVAKHCRKDCRHYGSENLAGIKSFDVIETIERLAREIGRVPAQSDWNGWDDRPCSTTALQEHRGSWKDLLDASDLPVVPNRAPEIIRETRYDNSEFAREGES